MDVCGPETEIILTEEGHNSSAIIDLSSANSTSVCRLKVKVVSPMTHIINVQFIESSNEIRRTLMENETVTNPPCLLSMVS